MHWRRGISLRVYQKPVMSVRPLQNEVHLSSTDADQVHCLVRLAETGSRGDSGFKDAHKDWD